MAGLINVGITKPELANAFAMGMEESQRHRNELARQRQIEQLGNIQMQNALREQRLAGEEEAAYKAAGNDLNKLQTELFQRGLGKQGLAVGAQMQTQQANKIKMLKDANDLKKSVANAIFANPNFESAIAATQAFGQRTGLDVTADLQQLQQIGDNPEGIRQWAAGHALEADKLMPKFETRDMGGTVQRQGYNPLTGAPIGPSTTYQKTMAPGEAERIKIEGQRLGLEGRRVAALEENLRRDADPAFQQRMETAKATGQAIAKGDVAAQQALPKILNRAEEGLRLIDELVGKQEVRDKNGKVIQAATKPHPGFGQAVGAGLPFRFIPGTSESDFQARFDQLKGASFLEAFEALKGGGAITEKEGAKATDAINRMSLSQSEGEFLSAARDLQEVIRKGVANAQRKAATGGGAPAAAPAAAGGVKFLGFE